jgi:hypothetical protein
MEVKKHLLYVICNTIRLYFHAVWIYSMASGVRGKPGDVRPGLRKNKCNTEHFPPRHSPNIKSVHNVCAFINDSTIHYTYKHVMKLKVLLVNLMWKQYKVYLF